MAPNLETLLATAERALRRYRLLCDACHALSAVDHPAWSAVDADRSAAWRDWQVCDAALPEHHRKGPSHY